MIKLVNVSKYYRSGKTKYEVLKGISISFPKSGFISILGPSGCGKTTLLNIIGCLDTQTEGDVFIDGKNTKEFTSFEMDSYRNQYLGFVFQKFNLINHLNIYDNVALTLKLTKVKKETIKKLVNTALDKVGIKHLAKKKPNEISGGEAQRASIARSIVNSPSVILADEPTGSLDSTNSNEVMKILKELSNNHLVILITHNNELAKSYSDKIISIKDGIIKETLDYQNLTNYQKPKKAFMNIKTSLGLSINNIYSKLVRTLLTLLAGCLGIIAVCLVLSISTGVDKYINQVQTNALEGSPIVIRSSTITTTSGNAITSKESYPDTDSIILTSYIYNYEEVNNIDNEFIEYIEDMDNSSYSVLNYNRSIFMRLVRRIENSFYTISNSSYFTEMIDDEVFIKSQYDLISGSFSKDPFDVYLVVDRYNCISESILTSLRVVDPYDPKEKYTYEEIINTTYKLILNSNYYTYDSKSDKYTTNTNALTLYNNSEVEIKICGILREKRNVSSIYSPGIIYSSKLTDFILDNSNNSQIVIDQKKYGLSKNVLTGLPYERQDSGSVTYSEKYLYDNNMINFGATTKIMTINIYSLTFEDRLYIENYIKSYSSYTSLKNISYNDYMSNLTNELTAFINVVSKILIILALVSLVISTLMIAIITHISVLERTKEIGILRSIGARKIDILHVFSSENIILGFISGVIGVGCAYLIRSPINKFIQDVIKKNVPQASSMKETNILEFDIKLILIMILGSTILMLIAGLIPSFNASIKKPVDALKSE